MSTTTSHRTGRSGGWDRYHQRADAVRAVLAELDRAPRADLPWNDELAAVFLDRDDLLEALHAVWTRRLLARVDLELEIGTGTPRESVEKALRATAEALPALRALLDQNAGSEVSRRCVAGEHRLLAVAAGLATLSDPAPYSARRGAALVTELLPSAPASRPTKRLPWLRALRHAPTAV